MRAINSASHKALADELVMAETFLDRLKGLLGKESLSSGKGMWIRPCKGIHTFGMRFPIDAVFLDKGNKVVALCRNLRPNHMTSVHFNAASVLELPTGAIDSTSTAVGDTLEFS